MTRYKSDGISVYIIRYSLHIISMIRIDKESSFSFTVAFYYLLHLAVKKSLVPYDQLHRARST